MLIKVEVGGETRPRLQEPPFSHVGRDPVGEPAMPDVPRAEPPTAVRISRVDHHVPARTGKERPHVGLKDVVFNEMVDYVEGKTQIGLLDLGTGQQLKAFGGIVGEPISAACNGAWADVKTDIARILRQRQLRTISAAKFDDRADASRLDEII